VSREHRCRRPRAPSGPDQSRLPIRERPRAAHEPQVRRAQRVGPRAQAGTSIPQPPHNDPGGHK
jgi:hypothetical protein